MSRIEKDTITFQAKTTFLILPTKFVGTFPAGVTTPSVLNVETFKANNIVPVTITNFLNAQEGQTLTILGDNFTTVANNSNISTNTGLSKLLDAGKIYYFTFLNNVWVELADSASSGGGGGGNINAGLANQLAYYAANGTTLSGLATSNLGILVTSALGVPSISSDLPPSITIGGAYIYRAGGSPIAASDLGFGINPAKITGGTFGVGNFNFPGNVTINGTLTFINLVVTGNSSLGDSTSDTITVTARFTSSLIPSSTNANDLGTSTLSWRNLWLAGTIDVDGAADFHGDLTHDGTLTYLAQGTSTDARLFMGSGVGSFGTILSIRAGAGFGAGYRFASGSNDTTGLRWQCYKSGDAESGGNAGSAFLIRAYSDTGGFIDEVIRITRVAGGAFAISRPVTMASTLVVTSNTTVNGTLTANGNLVVGNATSDTITITSRFSSSLIPATNNSVDFGTTALRWKDLWLSGNITIAGSITGSSFIQATEYRVGGTKVVGAQQSAITDAAGGTEITTINAILAALRAHGLIAT